MRFAGELTGGWDKVKRRLVSEMLSGIQAAKDVKISNVARSLQESIALIKTGNRLCRNLADEDFTERINGTLCWQAGGLVDNDTVLAVDLGDIRKDYAKKMQHLAGVRDGTTGQIVKGYWLCEVIAARPYDDRIVPLYGELYSQASEDFESENAQLLKAIDTVRWASGNRGIFAIDIGGDRRAIIIPLIDRNLSFVIRESGDRHILLPSGKKCSVRQADRWCKSTETRDVEVEREGRRIDTLVGKLLLVVDGKLDLVAREPREFRFHNKRFVHSCPKQRFEIQK